MVTKDSSANLEKLISQLSSEADVADAFERLVHLGDSAIPALVKALRNAEQDREVLYSALSSIETDAAYAVLTEQLFKSTDKQEQTTLALLLAQDGRGEISSWLIKQLPAHWQEGKWWQQAGHAQSEYIATMLASLISLDVDPAYLDWYEKILDGEDEKKQDIAIFIGELLGEVDIIEYDEDI
ncbi:hypothetical protein [Candidatus Chlorohelix sp.]|uniref:hypothetical protein n=1 Tax=Candidatus Chlorohelix sp. TaxID=3139201 RepID=UPI00304633AD